jgi:hypothetical protein
MGSGMAGRYGASYGMGREMMGGCGADCGMTMGCDQESALSRNPEQCGKIAASSSS